MKQQFIRWYVQQEIKAMRIALGIGAALLALVAVLYFSASSSKRAAVDAVVDKGVEKAGDIKDKAIKKIDEYRHGDKDKPVEPSK